MDKFQTNVVRSFRGVRKDILALKNEIEELKKQNKDLEERLKKFEKTPLKRKR